ncbi:MAG: flagellar basal body-associated FliL family protein [Gammaproteobacteria bacterium]|nr:flagellar basal body-associated FliL family protein [Gammaproteobacteria bacterium]MBL6998529.1 flagellar basal body-associated FliL family protein [Gammaproteobacteria bacterium]
MHIKSIEIFIISLLLILFSPLSVAAEEEATIKAKPSYVSLGDPMVLNLSTDSKRLTFLQLKADVLVNSDDAKEIVKKHIPAIRHQLIVLLSEQKSIDMKTTAKREEVRQLATAQIREMIENMTANKDIEEVLFTNFLVQ